MLLTLHLLILETNASRYSFLLSQQLRASGEPGINNVPVRDHSSGAKIPNHWRIDRSFCRLGRNKSSFQLLNVS